MFYTLDRSTERACVRDAVLAAAGVKSRVPVAWPRPAQALYARIAHLGFLHDRLKEFIDPASGLMPQGRMTLLAIRNMFCYNYFN